MSENYYEKDDLRDFPNIVEYAPEAGDKFFEYYGFATEEGHLSEREKSLIALTVSLTQNCPYCIDAWTNKCMSINISKEEMMEALHVGAAIKSGATLVHGVQMMNKVNKLEM